MKRERVVDSWERTSAWTWRKGSWSVVEDIIFSLGGREALRRGIV